MNSKQLKALRIKLGPTQKRLAKLLGVGTQHIADMEHGRSKILESTEKGVLALNYIFNNCNWQHFLNDGSLISEKGKPMKRKS